MSMNCWELASAFCWFLQFFQYTIESRQAIIINEKTKKYNFNIIKQSFNPTKGRQVQTPDTMIELFTMEHKRENQDRKLDRLLSQG